MLKESGPARGLGDQKDSGLSRRDFTHTVKCLFYFILLYFILFYFILFYFILLYFILFYCILFYFILFYFILFYFVFILFSIPRHSLLQFSKTRPW